MTVSRRIPLPRSAVDFAAVADRLPELTRRPREQVDALFARARTRSRRSWAERVSRLQSKAWLIGQAAAAAGLAWVLAGAVFHHADPVFAPICAVVALGTSYGQRLRRVAESTVGIVIGVLAADLFTAITGVGTWQIMLAVVAAMVAALLLDASEMLVGQAAVQAIVVASVAPTTDQVITRWQDALIGGGVALLAAAIVPAAPLRRPQVQAAAVARALADLLIGTAYAAQEGDLNRAEEVLHRARTTDPLVRELEVAAEEGLDVIASSPLRRNHSPHVRRISEIIDPLDRALRSTRVLTRRVVVAISDDEPFPPGYLTALCDLAEATRTLSHVLSDGGDLAIARPSLLAVGKATGELERTGLLSVEIVLGQMQSVVVDLLQVSGMSVDDSVAALPPVARIDHAQMALASRRSL